MTRRKAVHYQPITREEDHGTCTACGVHPSKNPAVTNDPKEVTCNRCPGTVKWKMYVRGMSYNQAVRHRAY